MALSFLYFTFILTLPSFLGMATMGLAYGEVERIQNPL